MTMYQLGFDHAKSLKNPIFPDIQDYMDGWNDFIASINTTD